MNTIRPFSIFWRSIGSLCAALLIVTPVHAAKDPNRDAMRLVQAKINKISDEKAVLEQEKVTLNKELETLKNKSVELESANKRKAMLEKETGALKQDKTKLLEQIEQLKKELSDSQLALRDSRQNLQQETGQKEKLTQNLSTRDKELEVCGSKNQKLYQYHVELLNLAQGRGSLGVLLENEPVLGLKRVEVENILEEYRDKIDKEHISPRN